MSIARFGLFKILQPTVGISDISPGFGIVRMNFGDAPVMLQGLFIVLALSGCLDLPFTRGQLLLLGCELFEWRRRNFRQLGLQGGPGVFVELEGLNERILNRTPAGRWGTPTDLAGIAVFLGGSASDFVTGAAIPVDGGYSAEF